MRSSLKIRQVFRWAKPRSGRGGRPSTSTRHRATAVDAVPRGTFRDGRLFTPRVDHYSQIVVRTHRYSVPIRLIGNRVRVVLHASHLRP
ncbi:Mu transposase domain-containing protein [Streptomyces sioyaensis]|uniref:Mu transposase domain-containing protein n=1 Tax=Streptomyces sioyaensis TaxID=67364 RepID=UPI003798D00E